MFRVQNGHMHYHVICFPLRRQSHSRKFIINGVNDFLKSTKIENCMRFQLSAFWVNSPLRVDLCVDDIDLRCASSVKGLETVELNVH